MPIKKRDRNGLKKEYMESDIETVWDFLVAKGVSKKVVINSKHRERTRWWAREKRELKKQATDKAIARVWNKLAKQLEPSTEFLLWNIAKAIELTKVKLDQMEQKWNINVKDLNTIRWMNRIQNWQPTTYVKEESDVNQNIRIEWIHIVMWWNNISQWEKDVDEKV
jgi:hypothetical protein